MCLSSFSSSASSSASSSLLISLLTLLTLALPTLCIRHPQLTEAGSHDNSAQCQCYLTTGPNPGYFQYYRFFDFRAVASTEGDWFVDPPPVVSESEDQGTEPITSQYFNTTIWNQNWSIESGLVPDKQGTYDHVNSAANVYITRNTSDAKQSTYMTLRTTRNGDFQSTAEIDCNQKNLLHSSIRARLRVIPEYLLPESSAAAEESGEEYEQEQEQEQEQEEEEEEEEEGEYEAGDGSYKATHPVAPGAVVGFFTFESNTQESDLEILTSDPIDRLRYSNQPDYNPRTGNSIPGASTDFLMEDDRVWTDWLVHRLDWFPGVSQWWIDQDLVLNKTIHVPRKPSGLIVNVWSDGGEWSGNMSVGDQVVVAVEWIEMVFNISGSLNGPGTRYSPRGRRGLIDALLLPLPLPWKRSRSRRCELACWVDAPHITEPGHPVVAYDNTQEDSASGTTAGLLSIYRYLLGWAAVIGMAFVLV